MTSWQVTWSQGIAVGTTSALSHALMGQVMVDHELRREEEGREEEMLEGAGKDR